jgi:hypothetical protein
MKPMPPDPELEIERVRRHTADPVNQKIDDATAQNIRHYRNQSAEVIAQRIRALEDEWNIERVLEVNASTLALTGLLLGATVNRRWLLLSSGVLGFLLLHGLHGWCPPVPFLRRAGIRTRSEIDREKAALKYARGDFYREADSRPSTPRRLGALIGAT